MSKIRDRVRSHRLKVVLPLVVLGWMVTPIGPASAQAGPVAVDDSYAVISGDTLTVPPPSILANDTNLPADASFVARNPNFNGTLTTSPTTPSPTNPAPASSAPTH